MDTTLRTLDIINDLSALAELFNDVGLGRAGDGPVTPDSLWTRELNDGPTDHWDRIVAVGPDRDLCGFGTVGRRDHHWPGLYSVRVMVHPDWRLQGIGTLLYDALAAQAVAHGAAALAADVNESVPEWLDFALRRGFEVTDHQFRSSLTISEFDEEPFAGKIEALEAEGIRFFSFADTDGGPEAQHRLYDLNTETGLDVPGSENRGIRPFDQFARDVFGGYWFRPDAQIFAADGDRWIGMAAVGETSPGVMDNMMTGVLRPYRGRGIALALKLLAVRFCRRHGATVMCTSNNSRNAPMLAVNRKMGYVPEPGMYHVVKHL